MSYVAPEVSASDASTLASDATGFLAKTLPPAKTILMLDPPKGTEADVLTLAITDNLRARGYGLVIMADNYAPKDTQAVPFLYLASPLDNGIVLRLQFKGQEATKLYPRTTTGSLLTNGPFLLREADQ